MASSTLMAVSDFPSPSNVRIDGDKLLWDPVDEAGGYNIYVNRGYLTTVRNRTEFQLQIDGLYQVVAFDESSTRFSRQNDPSVRVTYDAGSSQSEDFALGLSVIKVVGITCRNVGAGETCSASCRLPGEVRLATGGSCSTSAIVEADASASPFSYSCTVPTFSGEVRASAYCIDAEAIR